MNLLQLAGLSFSILCGIQSASADYYEQLIYRDDGESITITGCDWFAEGTIEIPAEIDGKPVTAIANGAFFDVRDIDRVIFPDTLVSIGEEAFLDCQNLGGLQIPASVTTIGDNAFESCGRLTYIELPANITSLGTSVFAGCNRLRNVKIHTELAELPAGTFANCRNLVGVEMPYTITRVGSSAFYNCWLLENIVIPEFVDSIGTATFSHCYALKNITLPAMLKSIGSRAFEHTNLSGIVLNPGLESIGSYAFSECDDLATIAIPASVKTIGTKAFEECPIPCAIFLGNAPVADKLIFGERRDFTVYVQEGSQGFTFPKWQGYRTSLPAPEITVRANNAADLLSGISLRIFGLTVVGKVGKSTDFTITNSGTRPLKILRIGKAGNGGKEFSGGTVTNLTLQPGEEYGFAITFKPVVVGRRQAMLRIFTNDPDESPFKINLVGTGRKYPKP